MHETTAFFYARGIELTILAPDDAKQWARSLVDGDMPGSGEVIDSAIALSTSELVTTLRSAANGANEIQAARWLVHVVEERFRGGQLSGLDAAILALSVCAACGFFEASDKFDGICDGFSLAEAGAYGTTSECVAELESALSLYGAPRPHDS